MHIILSVMDYDIDINYLLLLTIHHNANINGGKHKVEAPQWKDVSYLSVFKVSKYE